MKNISVFGMVLTLALSACGQVVQLDTHLPQIYNAKHNNVQSLSQAEVSSILTKFSQESPNDLRSLFSSTDVMYKGMRTVTDWGDETITLISSEGHALHVYSEEGEEELYTSTVVNHLDGGATFEVRSFSSGETYLTHVDKEGNKTGEEIIGSDGFHVMWAGDACAQRFNAMQRTKQMRNAAVVVAATASSASVWGMAAGGPWNPTPVGWFALGAGAAAWLGGAGATYAAVVANNHLNAERVNYVAHCR